MADFGLNWYSPDQRVSKHMHLTYIHCAKSQYIHQVTTMLGTSSNILFLGPKSLLTTGADKTNTLIIARTPGRVIIKAKGHQHG